MIEKQSVIEQIRAAFQDLEFPGERYLQGSFEGEEPEEEIGPFRARKVWANVEADFLDLHASALSFFSHAGFRFFLPAYLIADLNDELSTADPLFHLTHGFLDSAVKVKFGDKPFVIKVGKSTLINPRRYGAATTADAARYKLSIFTREEAGAIVAYLEFKRDHDPDGLHKASVDAALESFWLERARTAPTAQDLRRHLTGEKERLDAIEADARARSAQ